MSSSHFIDPLVTGESLQKELSIRNKPHYEASISHKRLPTYEDMGWYILRKNKTTFRIRLDKNLYELLEDELWSLYAKLGFTELNKDREFKIQCSDSTIRKIDIFARDEETVLFTECTSAESPGTKKSLTDLIDKIKSYREDAIKAVYHQYGRNDKLKFGFIIATKNIVWSDPDLKRAEEAQIMVLKDEEVNYFSSLQKNLKSAARYQFLANIFAGKTIPGLDIKVPATKGKMGGEDFYTFLISPDNLLKIAYVSHINSKGAESINTYQRMLNPRRLNNIASYINDGGKFPTNIVVNLHYKRNLSYDKKDEIGDLSFGELTLPAQYASAWVIDGQHRLYGYAHSDRSKDSVVPVLAFANLDATSQKNLFVDINNKQVKVKQNILLDLYAELHWGSDNPHEAITSLCSRLTKTLGTKMGSPFYNRIIIGEKSKSNYICLTITTITNSLINEQLLGSATKIGDDSVLLPGALGSSDKNLEKSLKRALTFLTMYFSIFKDAMPEQWELGDAKGGYICTNNAIVALLKILKSTFDVLEKRDHIDLISQSEEDLLSEVNRYVEHLVNWLSSLDDEKFKSLRSKQGVKGQTAVAREMQQVIYNKDNNFQPKGLVEWMESFDKEGSIQAKELIDEIQLSMLELTLNKLKEKHKDEWWYEGIPSGVRKKCVERREDEKGKLDEYQYLDLIDYKTIASSSSNWSSIFQSYFTLQGQTGDKNSKLSWIVRLNEIRKTVSHPERGLLSKEEVDFVQDLYNKLKSNFGEYWKS